MFPDDMYVPVREVQEIVVGGAQKLAVLAGNHPKEFSNTRSAGIGGSGGERGINAVFLREQIESGALPVQVSDRADDFLKSHNIKRPQAEPLEIV